VTGIKLFSSICVIHLTLQVLARIVNFFVWRSAEVESLRVQLMCLYWTKDHAWPNSCSSKASKQLWFNGAEV